MEGNARGGAERREPVIVGRDDELDIVREFATRRTGTRALILDGPAGIGKTTLWVAGTHAAEETGVVVMRARPAENEADYPYATLADLVGPVFDAVREALPNPQEHALAEVLLRTHGEGPVDVRIAATAVATLLTRLESETPVLIAIDDCQWIDPVSDEILAFVARRLSDSTRVLVSRRTETEADRSLGLLRSLAEHASTRIELRSLSLASIHHLIRDQLGYLPPKPLLSRIMEVSGGNPYIALELARSLDSSVGGLSPGDDLPVPAAIRHVLSARLDRLSDRAKEAVLLVALLFRPTRAAIVVAMGSEEAAHSALVEAEEVGVLDSKPDRIGFVHPIVASVVIDTTPGEVRRRLHERIAANAQGLEERGHHLAQCAEEGDDDAAAVIAAAAEHAAERGAHSTACRLFDAASRVSSGRDRDDLARYRLGASSAYARLGDSPRARSLAEEALVTTPEPAVEAAAYDLLAELAWHDGDAARAAALEARAIEACADDVGARARFLVRNVRFQFAHDFPAAARDADAAIALLQDERDPLLLSHVLIDGFWAGVICGERARPELLERGLSLEARASNHVGEPQAIPLIWSQCTDEILEARDRFAHVDAWWGDRGDSLTRADIRSHLAIAELRAGDWVTAERLLDEADVELAGVEARGPLAMVLEKRALVDAHRGRTIQARQLLHRLVDQFEAEDQRWWAALCLSSLAFTELSDGDGPAGLAAIARMHEHAHAVGAREIPFDRSEPMHIEALLDVGAVDEARTVLASLEARGHATPRAWITAALPRACALLADAEGRTSDALELLAAGSEAAAALPYELAWTQLAQGRVLRRLKRKRLAADALEAAISSFTVLGATSWADRARHELERVGLRRRPEGELTATEQTIAQLAATGLTNRQIAQAAFVSAKTVEANLARVYRKLGIHSRAELGAAIERQR